MDLLHVHLLLNHVPVVGIPLGAALLAWGVLRRERAVQRAALALLVVVGLAAGPVFLTGEPAEARVEQLPGVSEATIGRHESVAEIAVITSHLVWIAGAIALFTSRGGRPLRRGLAVASLAIALVATGVLAPTAWLGGQIRHTEIGGATTSAAPGQDEGGRDRQ